VDTLHVVTPYFNPMRWKSRIRLYQAFEAHMLASGVHLTTVECAFGDRPFETGGTPGVNYVQTRTKSLCWTKENLINIGISRLPQDWKYVAWIDADIAFRKQGWASETVHALQQYDLVQPWSECYDLGPDDDHLQVHVSFCKLFHQRKPIVPSGQGGYCFAHPGYCFAATRTALEWLGGLIETAALGAGDHHMALALIGRVRDSVPGNISAGYMDPLLRWQERASKHICQNIGYLPATTIEHYWHGDKSKRKYVERWEIVTGNQFDPATDLKRNVWGVLELAGNKPKLRHDLDLYLRSRNEDATTL